MAISVRSGGGVLPMEEKDSIWRISLFDSGLGRLPLFEGNLLHLFPPLSHSLSPSVTLWQAQNQGGT